MTKHVRTPALIILGLLTLAVSAGAAESTVPEPFRDFDDNSKYSISYDDLTLVLKTVVVDMGLSTRKVAEPAPDVTGTRMKAKVKKTANEGNRFYYETFRKDEDTRKYLLGIQKSLEELPSEVPLKYFSRDEQLAYWLNLYNVTVINQVIEVYPKRSLKKLFRGKNSIFEQKLLTVAGIPLSLNDIQFTILKQNYDNNPLIIYGLYQGIIGGPNIRKSAYTGADVYRALENNAYEFINSNRGTYARDEKTFRVSSLYDRNREYFPDFETDLSAHLLTHLQGIERERLQSAKKIRADINDFDVTDLGGTHRRVGGSFATNRAALMDSVKGSQPDGEGGILAAAVGPGSSMITDKGKRLSRIEPELLAILQDINLKRLAENQRNATVTIDELEDDAPDETEAETEDDDEAGPGTE